MCGECRRRMLARVVGLSAIAVALGACSSGGSSPVGSRGSEAASYREEAAGVLGDLARTFEPGSVEFDDAGSEDQSWSVLIAQFPATAEGAANAERALQLVRTRGRLPEAYLKQRGSSLALLYGEAEELDDERIREDLALVRSMEIDGQKPYAQAVVAPPTMAPAGGSNPEFDLRGARREAGEDALYTLQIGLYGRIDRSTPSEEELAEYRRAAEDAVRQLRAQGEQAFYYHAPTRSTVTVGVFGEEDHDPRRGASGESARLRATRERFPHNLLNGKGITQKLRDTSGRMVEVMQKSRLVPIPG